MRLGWGRRLFRVKYCIHANRSDLWLHRMKGFLSESFSAKFRRDVGETLMNLHGFATTVIDLANPVPISF